MTDAGEGVITNVREVDDHKEYKFEFSDPPRIEWVHETEAKATYPALVKDFKKRMKARKEEKKRLKSMGTPEQAPPAAAPDVPESVKEEEEEAKMKEKKKKREKKEKKSKSKAPIMPPPPPSGAPPQEEKEKEEVAEVETVEPPEPPEPPKVTTPSFTPPEPPTLALEPPAAVPEPPTAAMEPPAAAPAPAAPASAPAPPSKPQPDANEDADENSEEELSQAEDDPPEKIFRIVREEGAIVRKYADMSSPLVGTCPFGEIITITDTNRLWFDNDNLCVGMKPADIDEDDDEGYWRVEVIAPFKWKGWISMKSHIIDRVENEPKIFHRQALRKKAEALYEITKSMVEVSLVAARHSAQLRSQRSKVFAGCKSLVNKEDPRVLGVLGQMNADDIYDTRVSTTVRKGLDKVTSQFVKVQEAETELSNVEEIFNYDETDDHEKGPGNDSEFLELNKELYTLQKEYIETENRLRTYLD